MMMRRSPQWARPRSGRALSFPVAGSGLNTQWSKVSSYLGCERQDKALLRAAAGPDEKKSRGLPMRKEGKVGLLPTHLGPVPCS